MKKIIKISAIILASLSLAACGNQSSAKKTSNDDSYKHETRLQLSNQYGPKIADKQQNGEKLTPKEKAIVKAHEEQQKITYNKTLAKFNGKTAVFPTRGTVEVQQIAKVPTYTDEGTLAKKQAVVIKAKITNTSKKTRDTDSIQTGNNEHTNLGLTVWQNSDSTKENLSDDHEADSNYLASDADSADGKIAGTALEFGSPKILPGKSVTVIYDAFYLVNNKNSITLKIQDGTGMSNAGDVLKSKNSITIPLSEIKETTLTQMFAE